MRSGPSQSNCTKTKLAGRSSDSLELCIISTPSVLLRERTIQQVELSYRRGLGALTRLKAVSSSRSEQAKRVYAIRQRCSARMSR